MTDDAITLSLFLRNWRAFIISGQNTPTIAALAIMLVAAPTYSKAASDAVCTIYAEKTVAQHSKNLGLGCGFAGLRWHDNKIGHFVFCKTAAKSVTDAELQVRSELLAQCSGETADAAPQNEIQPDPNEPDLNEDAQAGRQDGDGEAENLQLELNDLPADDQDNDEDFIDEG